MATAPNRIIRDAPDIHRLALAPIPFPVRVPQRARHTTLRRFGRLVLLLGVVIASIAAVLTPGGYIGNLVSGVDGAIVPPTRLPASMTMDSNMAEMDMPGPTMPAH